jgi:putative ABC transport system permease protein
MIRILKLAARNLARYWRRTLLTTGLIVLGVAAVLLFIAVSGSFKSVMIAQITDSMLGHLQIHRKGYVASIENLPLHLNIQPDMVQRIEQIISEIDETAVSTPRLKFGAMLSNFTETTSIRLNGIIPDREKKAMPMLADRLVEGNLENGLVAPGKLLAPQLLARGMNVKVGDTVVLVATNADGSVNGRTFTVQGILEAVTGPGGRDGYLHMDDARELLRIQGDEINEIAVRLNDIAHADRVESMLESRLSDMRTPGGQPVLEIHTWDQLTPFANIARMIDLLDLFIRILLVGIVLISIMNVMVMAVYERIREIGTMAAIGTPPRRISALFVGEGLLLGLIGTIIGALISLAAVRLMNVWPVTFAFGRQEVVLAPGIAMSDVVVVCTMVLLVAVIGSLQPAWKAARMDPVAALRHV